MTDIVDFVLKNIDTIDNDIVHMDEVTVKIRIRSVSLMHMSDMDAQDAIGWLIEDIEDEFPEYDAFGGYEEKGWAEIKVF